MMDTTILSWVTFIYFAAFVFYLFRIILGREFWGKLATGTALAGLAAQSVALIIRWKHLTTSASGMLLFPIFTNR